VRPPPRWELPEVHRARTGANALRADTMTAAERLFEVAQILAGGLSRLKARQSSAQSADFGESSLDCAAHQSGPANVLKDGGCS
jgi:hypothetical protein